MTTRPIHEENGPSGGLPAGVVERLVTFIERTSDLVAVTDDRGNLVYVNAAAAALLGRGAAGAEDLTTADLFSEKAFEIYFEQVRPAILRGEPWQGVVPLHVGDAEPVEMWMSVVGGTRAGGEVTWLVATARDVSDWVRVREGLQWQATHDDLTDVAGRGLLMDRLDVALARTARSGTAIVVAYVDVDGMKQINDRFGHPAGDQALVEVARRLQAAVRPSDTVARMGGDEFVVVLEGFGDPREAEAGSDRIADILSSLTIEVSGRPVHFSASVGAAIASGPADAHDLLTRADLAMYGVKGARRDRGPRRGARTPPRPVAASAHDIAVALTQGAIIPHYQRVMDAATGAPVGYQALARWHTATGEVRAAAVFVAALEHTAAAIALDLTILRRAADDLEALAAAVAAPQLYVHLSRELLVSDEAPMLVQGIFERAAFDPGQLHLVVDDHLFDHGGPAVIDALMGLEDLGLHTVINAGRSPSPSLGEALDAVRCRALRFLVGGDDLTGWADRAAAMIRLARRHDIQAFAVGVETPDQLARLVELGTDLAEGLLWGPPLPANGVRARGGR